MFCIYVNRWLDLERSPFDPQVQGCGTECVSVETISRLNVRGSLLASSGTKSSGWFSTKVAFFNVVEKYLRSGKVQGRRFTVWQEPWHCSKKVENNMRCIFVKMNPFTLFIQKQLWPYFPLHCMIQNQIHILRPVYSDTILPPWVVTTLTCCLKSPVLWTSPQR